MCPISLNMILFLYTLYLIRPVLEGSIDLFLLLFLRLLAHDTLFPCILCDFIYLLFFFFFCKPLVFLGSLFLRIPGGLG